jgi:peptidase E
MSASYRRCEVLNRPPRGDNAAVSSGGIVAIGGWPWLDPAEHARLRDYLLDLAGGRKVCVVPTAGGEDDFSIARFLELWPRCELSVVRFYPWPPEDVRERVLGADLIVVPGGNTANMLAVWRTHGFDALVREAWEAGATLAGWSAGMICWFEQGVTDSFGPQLEAMQGLGWLPGSACPHYDGEELRRPRYHELIRGGLPAGLAADDAVGLCFDGTELSEVVTAREGSRAYRVAESGSEIVETPLDPRILGSG